MHKQFSLSLAAAALVVSPAVARAGNSAAGDVIGFDGTLSGELSDPFVSSFLQVGRDFSGSYRVSNGSLTELDLLTIGRVGAGDVTVTGFGSRLSTELFDGTLGRMRVVAGGTVTTVGSSLAFGVAALQDGGDFTLDVDGVGSSFQAGGAVTSGEDAGEFARFNITNGGRFVTSERIEASLQGGSTRIVVDGAGSVFDAGGDLFSPSRFGSDSGGVSEIRVADGGSFQTGSIEFGTTARVTLDGGTMLVDDFAAIFNGNGVNGAVLRGSGELASQGGFEFRAGSHIEVAEGDHLRLNGVSANPGSGITVQLDSATANVFGGTLEANAGIDLTDTIVSARDATLRASFISIGEGEASTFAFLAGTNDVFARVILQQSSQTVISFDTDVVFFERYTNNGTTHVERDATATFLGTLDGGGDFTGEGEVFIFGKFLPGNSPAAVSFGGDLTLGDTAATVIELGGTTRGDSFDALLIDGLFTVDGDLEIVLIDGFTPRFGDAFDLFDFGDLEGTFAGVSLPTLGGGLSFDTSELLTTGVLRVVPEPAASMALLALLPILSRRR